MVLSEYIKLLSRFEKIEKELKILDLSNIFERKRSYLLQRQLEQILIEVQAADKPRLMEK